PIEGWGSMSSIKRGSRKKLRLDRRARRFWSRDPAHWCECATRFAREVLLWLVCHPCGSCADGDDANRVWRLGKRVLVSSMSTTVLSEARRLSLFLMKHITENL